MHNPLTIPRRLVVLAVGLLAAACGMAVSAGAAHAAVELPTDTPVGELVFEHSGKVVNVAGAGTALGTPLIQWPDANGSFVNDQFKFVKAPASTEGPNRYYILPLHATNKRIGASCTILDPPGCAIEVMSPLAGRQAIWHAEPTGDGRLHLVNQATARAMNVAAASSDDGAALIDWPRQMAGSSPFHNDHILIRAGS